MENSLLQLGAIGVIFVFAIREFFAYLRVKKESENGKQNEGGNYLSGLIVKELQLMNTNHLSHIQQAISDGNDRLIEQIRNDNMKIIEVLYEIKGQLINK